MKTFVPPDLPLKNSAITTAWNRVKHCFNILVFGALVIPASKGEAPLLGTQYPGFAKDQLAPTDVHDVILAHVFED